MKWKRDIRLVVHFVVLFPFIIGPSLLFNLEYSLFTEQMLAKLFSASIVRKLALGFLLGECFSFHST